MPVITKPPASPYNDQFVSYAVAVGSSGAEGCKTAPFTCLWSTLNAQTFGFDINFADRPNMPSQIATLYVDNTRCHLGIHILFPDTGFRLLIPPFVRGYYPVLTKATNFYAGIATTALAVVGDVTIIEAMNYSAPPIEREAFLANVNGTITFDPSAAVGPSAIVAAAANFVLLRNVSLQISGATGGAAGLTGLFTIFADTVAVIRAGLTLGIAEFVDASELLKLTNLNQAALAWTYQWTIPAGALTGAAVAILNFSYDLADIS